MTFDEMLRKVLVIFPDAEAGEDSDGQIVIYTDVELAPNGMIRKYIPSPDDIEYPSGESNCQYGDKG